MMILPAIDIREGKCVRLKRGRDGLRTDYGNPVDAAREWIEQGAEFIHTVDLDGAFYGGKFGSALIDYLAPFRKIIKLGAPVQIGGGMRSMADIDARFAIGAARVVLGTVALTDPDIVREACAKYPGRIVCGIDARNGKASIRGWTEDTNADALALAQSMQALGVEWVVYTDVSRDGMLTGPNVTESARMARESGMKVIGSGGVGTLDDIAALAKAGCVGAIVGKALYEKRFTLADAINTGRDYPYPPLRRTLPPMGEAR